MDDKPKKLKAFVRKLHKAVVQVNPDWQASDYAIPMSYLLEEKTFGISVNPTFIRSRIALVMAGIKKIAPATHKELNKELGTIK